MLLPLYNVFELIAGVLETLFLSLNFVFVI